MPRRAKPPEEGKRVPLNMRTTRDVRDRLAAAARASGRSLAQEVEYRLERSFQDQDIGKQIADRVLSELGPRLDQLAKAALSEGKS
jgi:hypothetical protein